MSAAIDYLMNTTEIVRVDDEHYTTLFNSIEFLIWEREVIESEEIRGMKNGVHTLTLTHKIRYVPYFDALSFRKQWIETQQLENENLQQFLKRYEALAFYNQTDYIAEYEDDDNKTGKIIHLWVNVKKFDSFLSRMCPKFEVAVDEFMDGKPSWVNRFNELIYCEFTPSFEKWERVIKDGRLTNEKGRANGQRQQSDNNGYVEYIALANAKHGSPAEKAIKTVARERFEQPKKSPNGTPLKKEAFIIPEEFTSNEKRIKYDDGTGWYENWFYDHTNIIERAVHHFRDCFDKYYSSFVVKLDKGKKTEKVFDEKLDKSDIWYYDLTLTEEENAKKAQEFIKRVYPYLGYLMSNAKVE